MKLYCRKSQKNELKMDLNEFLKKAKIQISEREFFFE